MRKNTKRLINPKKIRRKQKEAGIKKGSRDNSCNDMKAIYGTLPNGDTYSIDVIGVDDDDLKESSKINSSIINTLRCNMAEDNEELETVKLLIYYLRLTIYDFPEISKKLLFGDELTTQEKLIIRQQEKEWFEGESEETISILKNNF